MKAKKGRVLMAIVTRIATAAIRRTHESATVRLKDVKSVGGIVVAICEVVLVGGVTLFVCITIGIPIGALMCVAYGAWWVIGPKIETEWIHHPIDHP